MAPAITPETDGVAERVGALVLSYPRAVVLLFLALSVVFAGGLTTLSVGEDFDRYTQGTAEQEALDAVENDFETFEADTGTRTLLIHSGTNVLAKPSLVRMLELQARLEDQGSLHVESTRSIAGLVARELDPRATTTTAQLRTIEGATDAEVRAAVRSAAATAAGTRMVSEDYNPDDASASYAVTTVEHSFPGGEPSDETALATQRQMQDVADQMGGTTIVWGSEILFEEADVAVSDSLSIVVPFVLVLVLLFLSVAFRDLIDVVLAFSTLLVALVWTFGFAGLQGIKFDQMLLATAILLLAVGIDFGIHIVNRYREEAASGTDRRTAMATAVGQLNVALFIVTVTAAIGFGANLVSPIKPIRNYGLVSAAGISSTYLLFGLFLPALKLLVDDYRERLPWLDTATDPLGAEQGLLGRVLPLGYQWTSKAPVVVLAMTLVVAGVATVGATDIEREYDVQDFLPPEEDPGYVDYLPASMQPSDYKSPRVQRLFDENFRSDPTESVIFYVEGPLTDPYTLTEIRQAERNPPDSFVTVDGYADHTGVIQYIERYKRDSDAFARLVARNDQTGNGIPDTNLERVYAELLASPYGAEVRSYLRADARSMRIVYRVDSDASRSEIAADAATLSEAYGVSVTPTGEAIIFNTVDELMMQSAIQSLGLALAVTAVFLIAMYQLLEDEALLGLVNLVPLLVTVALLGGTMRVLRIPLNSLTATVFTVTVGVGVDYSVHITHRFIDEYAGHNDVHAALLTALRGTGGALTGSLVTTVSAMSALLLALSPILSQFGLLMSIGIAYAYLTSMVVLPAVIVLWEAWTVPWSGFDGLELGQP